jgi:hypothetical protein
MTSGKKTLVCMCNELNKIIQFEGLHCWYEIYEVHQCDGSRWHDIHTKFHEDWFRHSDNINVIASKIGEAAVLVLLMGRIYDVRR